MIFGVLSFVVLFLAVSARDQIKATKYDLDGSYHMSMEVRSQYVFDIEFSQALNQYLVVATAQSLGWATARLNFINDTAVNLTCDDGDVFTGIISYPTDLPSICWPGVQDFVCWNRLLSNITRIHVINM